MLSMARSCLRAQGEDSVRWGTDFFRIRGGITADDGTASTIEYVWQKSPKRASALFLSDVRTPLLQFIGTLPTIIFLPQDLDIFIGSPSARRSFLDALLSQLKPDFSGLRIEYERVLKQRNAVLAGIADGKVNLEDLTLWDSRLAASAAGLILLRDEVIGLFNRNLKQTIAKLGEGEWKDIRMVHDRKTKETDAKALEAEMLRLLEVAHEKDLVVHSTTVGPHRDDWHVRVLDRDIAVFASRGQQRSAFVALLLTSAVLFRCVRGERPIILLDDVLSELDERHQSALLSSLEGHQVFITTTHPVEMAGERQMWSVGEGNVVS